MADELRRQCSDPRCGRRFSSYNNLVLHERTAHLQSNILQQLGSIHTGHDCHHYSTAVGVDSDIATLPSVTEGLQSNYYPPGQSTNHDILPLYADATLSANIFDEVAHEANDHNLDIERSPRTTSPSNNVVSHVSLELTAENICTPSIDSSKEDSLGPSAEEDPLLLDFVIRELSNTDDVVDQSLPRDLHSFYKSFNDSSRVLFAEVAEPDQKLTDLSQACQEAIMYCMRKRMSQDEIIDHYDHISTLERIYLCAQADDDSGWSSTVTGIFGCGKKFAARVHSMCRIVAEHHFSTA